VREGGSPISPIIARLLLAELGAKPQEIALIPSQALPTGAVLPPISVSVGLLSAREVETLNLLARGFTYAECADLLGISTHTVGTHVKHIYRKLEVSSRAEAVFEAASMGILDPH
jgi:DNA-binding CsgD family transcriptional regulator